MGLRRFRVWGALGLGLSLQSICTTPLELKTRKDAELTAIPVDAVISAQLGRALAEEDWKALVGLGFCLKP